PVHDPDDPGRLIGVLTVARPNRSLEPFIEAGQRRMLHQGAWLVGLSAVVAVLVTAWLSRRIGRLARYARAVAAGEPAAHRHRAATSSATWRGRWRTCAASWRARPTWSSTCSR